jgi:RimJ/RimL family protein N-acetyltransferase
MLPSWRSARIGVREFDRRLRLSRIGVETSGPALEDTMERTYPRQIHPSGGATFTIRPMSRDDEEVMLAFYGALPPEYTLHRREDVRDPDVVRGLVREYDPSKTWTLLVFNGDDRVVGAASLVMCHHGWRRHVGEIRGIVTPAYARQGLAMSMVRELLARADDLELMKVEVLILDEHLAVKRGLQQMGFREEARLSDHALDREDHLHDLLVMTHEVHNSWKQMEELANEMDMGRFGC